MNLSHSLSTYVHEHLHTFRLYVKRNLIVMTVPVINKVLMTGVDNTVDNIVLILA